MATARWRLATSGSWSLPSARQRSASVETQPTMSSLHGANWPLTPSTEKRAVHRRPHREPGGQTLSRTFTPRRSNFLSISSLLSAHGRSLAHRLFATTSFARIYSPAVTRAPTPYHGPPASTSLFLLHPVCRFALPHQSSPLLRTGWRSVGQ